MREEIKHKFDCICFMCEQRKQGISEEKIRDNFHKLETDNLKKHGWYIHGIQDDHDFPLNFNAHTHGLMENFNHPDIQIVFPLDLEIAHDIFWNVFQKISSGRNFQNGDIVEEIISNGYLVKFVDAKENDRDVLRIIFPDVDGNLERDSKHPFSLQYEDL